MNKSNLKLLKDHDNISITGYRIISILKLLLERPYSEEEINSYFSSDSIVSRTLSKDTICIYINTLRSMGCIISRPSRGNDYKYVLRSHPFGVHITDKGWHTLIELRKRLSCFEDWKLMYRIDRLLLSLANEVACSNQREEAINLVMSCPGFLNEAKINLINTLEKYCKEGRTIQINYKSPETGLKVIEVIADNIAFENGCFYLWCFNSMLEEIQYLRIDRIKEIKVVNLNLTTFSKTQQEATYSLRGLSAVTYEKEANEEILEKTSDTVVIKTILKNKFKFIQKMLSFGSDCTILSPLSIKEEFVLKLKKMEDLYNNSVVK